jgi:parvulin-like peptidyl-prolyl isomerase
VTATSLRRAALVLTAAGALMLTSACSGAAGGGAALTVNGEVTTNAEFQDELQAYADNETALTEFASQRGLTVTEGEGDETLPSDITAQLATQRVAYMLLDEELATRDIEVTEEDIDAALEELIELSAPQADPTTGEVPEGESAFEGFSEEFQRKLAADSAAVTALTEALTADPPEAPAPTEEEIDTALEEQTAEGLACASIIVTTTAAEADAAIARVEGGEDFDAVAAEVSPDQGGPIGCQAEGTNPPALEEVLFALGEDEIGGPVELGPDVTGTAEPVFVVVKRTAPPTRDEVTEQLVAAAEASVAESPINAFVIAALEDAEVEVASRYGEWDPDNPNGPSVVPPGGPTTTAAVVPSVDPATQIDPATGQPVPAEGG